MFNYKVQFVFFTFTELWTRSPFNAYFISLFYFTTTLFHLFLVVVGLLDDGSLHFEHALFLFPYRTPRPNCRGTSPSSPSPWWLGRYILICFIYLSLCCILLNPHSTNYSFSYWPHHSTAYKCLSFIFSIDLREISSLNMLLDFVVS